MAVLVPHFAYPFRFVTEAGVTHAAVNEQDSYDEIYDAVVVSALFTRGWFANTDPDDPDPGDPDFGITDQTFRSPNFDMDLLREELVENEPRAVEIITQRPVEWDALTAQIIVDVFSSQEVSS